jgi:protein involved in polysaccharide export with SLBB domain
MSVKGVPFISAAGRTAKEAERRLEQKLKNRLKRESVTIVLTPVTPLEKHKCSVRRAVRN